MTINLAWIYRDVAYLVADSAYTHRAPPEHATTSFGQATARSGGVTVEEGAPKIVRLSDFAIGTFNGNALNARSFLAALSLRIDEPRPLDDLLRDVWTHHERGCGPFSVLVARGAGAPEIVEFCSSDPDHPARLAALAPDGDPVRVAVRGSTPEEHLAAIRSMTALITLAGTYPAWTIAAVAAWLLVLCHYEDLVAHGVGGYVLGAAVSPDGVVWMGDLRVVAFPADTVFIGGASPSHPPRPDEGDPTAVVDLAVFCRDQVPVVASSCHFPKTVVWAGGLDDYQLSVWRRKWTDAVLANELRYPPEVWVLLRRNERAVVFVSPHLTDAQHVQYDPDSESIWLSAEVRATLFAGRGSSAGVCQFFPQLSYFAG